MLVTGNRQSMLNRRSHTKISLKKLGVFNICIWSVNYLQSMNANTK